MSVSVSRSDDVSPSERHVRILDAAERRFVRAGFHRTTMQDVAVEAGMSPGNLYRYFPSKDAIVVGLAERDRAQMACDFAPLSEAEDITATFVRLARKHFLEEPREKAVLCLEIWSEATRNPALSSLHSDFDADVLGRLEGLVQQAKEHGQVPASVDSQSVALLIATLANGLFVRRALSQNFDAEREVAQMIAVIEAAFAGRLDLPPGLSAAKPGSLP
jgi:TetR/AcrR family transcriptional repressor of uid operon